LPLQKTLTTVSLAAHISAACILDPHQQLIASYPNHQHNQSKYCQPTQQAIEHTQITEQNIVLSQALTTNEQIRGQLILTMDLTPLNIKIRRYTLTALVISLLLGLVACAFLWYWQKTLFSPIRKLTSLIHKATTQQQYQLQESTHYSNTDLRHLADSLNHMLQQAQQQIQRVDDFNQKLARSNQELEEFSYIASHDLKAPLRGLSNYALFLTEDYAQQLDTTANTYLNRIQALCTQMDTLVTSLLHYSRVGNRELAMQPTDLKQLVENTQNLLQEFIHEHHAVIQISDTLPTVLCDESLIAEVFNNLITNGIKYNQTPQKKLEIGRLNDSSQAFYVRDNGIGIAEQHHQKIFQIFQRLHSKDSFSGGSGAGLTIVKKIITRHGGEIWLESVPDEGTTFYFTLNTAPEDDDTA